MALYNFWFCFKIKVNHVLIVILLQTTQNSPQSIISVNYIPAFPTQKLAYKQTFLMTETKTLHSVKAVKAVFLVTRREFVLMRIQLQWRQLWCWAPAVFLTVRSPLQAEDQTKNPQTQFLPPSSPSVDPPPDPLYTQFQTVHASRVWIWAQAEPWGGRYLPQCTVAEHRGQSTSSSCCKTVKKKRQCQTHEN